MPKHIQMGTGFMSNATNISSADSSATSSELRPDLLSDHNLTSSSVSNNGAGGTLSCSGGSSSRASADGSNAGSYQMAMENIIDDYRLGTDSKKRFDE